MDPLAWIAPELARLETLGLRRSLKTFDGRQGPLLSLGGRTFVNFGSNDYLGLAGDPRLARAAAEAADAHGAGAGASPLVVGHVRCIAELEGALAELEQTERALVFPTGFAANLGTVSALVGRGDAVFSDELNHASLIDGCRLSRAEISIYPHNDMNRLEELLSQPRSGRALVVGDSLFSMDGDLAPVRELAELSRRHGAMLMLDEAHATGVFGPHGAGLAEECGVTGPIIKAGTLSKALGAAGGFVAGSAELIDWLVQKARPYVFSTALAPPAAAAAREALRIVRAEPERRRRLLESAADLRRRLQADGWDVGRSASQIVPVYVGAAEKVVRLSEKLAERGVLAPAIRPPTVPEGTSRLRISLSAAHTPEMIERLLEAMAEVGNYGN